jgi:hypothetical protein
MESLLIDIEQENQRAYDGLIVMIEAIQGKMGIIIAICDDPELQTEIINRYEQELSTYIRPYCLELSSIHPSPSGMVRLLVEKENYLQAKGAAVVTIIGANQLSTSKLSVKWDHEHTNDLGRWFGFLQWTRESFRNYPFPVVFWVNNRVLKELILSAKDFWSWRLDTFEFKSARSIISEVMLDIPKSS